jgi:CDP-diacylglycerol--glycerol-3-phosphate 3-phosphatidyltransferase
MEELRALRRQWAGLAIFSLLFFAWFFIILRNSADPGNALRWIMLAGIGLVYLFSRVWLLLGTNHRVNEVNLLPALGLGNTVTILRGVLVAGLAGFLLLPRLTGWQGWLPGAFYTLAAMLDYVDGWLARSRNQATRLGEALDLHVDSLGVLVATLLVVHYGQAPVWYLLVGMARYLFLGGIWLRRKLGRPVYTLPPSLSRRALAGIQMSLLFVLLWPVFTPPATHVAAALFSIPFLFGFTRDWLFASGVLHPSHGVAKSTSWGTTWFPVVLRLSVIVVGGSKCLGSLPNFRIGVDDLQWVFVGAQALTLLLTVLGVAGRSAAILGLGLIGVQQVQTVLVLQDWILMGLFTALLYLGSGKFSLWKPEEPLIYRRAGEK